MKYTWNKANDFKGIKVIALTNTRFGSKLQIIENFAVTNETNSPWGNGIITNFIPYSKELWLRCYKIFKDMR